MKKKRVTPKVAVVGAGLTGLTTAYYLKKAGIDIHLFERENRAGGVIHTLRENGFTFETGPNTGVLSHPEAMELLEELSGRCRLEIANQEAKFRWIWKEGRWHALPSGLMQGVTTPLFSFTDKLRILLEPFRPKGKNPEERLSELVKRRLGKSFLDYAVDPFILGIYAGDPAWLVPKYALPKLYNLEQNYGSFIRGTLRKRSEPKTDRDKKATREIFSVEGGLENLIHALVAEIGEEHIRLNCSSLTVEKESPVSFRLVNEDKVYGGFDKVVTTTGGYELEKLLPFVNPELTGHINRMQYARVAQITLGFRRWDGIPLKAFGGLVPFREQRDILGVLFLSSFLKNRAPEGGALLSVFAGGLRKPEMALLSDSELQEKVAREIKTMMGLKEFAPDLLRIQRYEHAIPQYGPESAEKLAAIARIEAENPGLILAGNIREGIGMADRIRQGRIIAEQIISG